MNNVFATPNAHHHHQVSSYSTISVVLVRTSYAPISVLV